MSTRFGTYAEGQFATCCESDRKSDTICRHRDKSGRKREPSTYAEGHSSGTFWQISRAYFGTKWLSAYSSLAFRVGGKEVTISTTSMSFHWPSVDGVLASRVVMLALRG